MRLPRASRTLQSTHPTRRRWLSVAVAVLLLGLLTAGLGGLALRASVDRGGRATFHAAATSATETLSSLLGRDGDFVATLRAVLSMQRRITPTGVQTWYELLQGSRRQIGGAGTAVVAAVSARKLISFQAQRNADPAFRRLVRGRITVVRRSHPGRYCLLAGGSAMDDLSLSDRTVIQSDWCQSAAAMGRYQLPLLRAAARTGALLTQSTNIGRLHAMYFEAALYRHGARLRTAAERAAAVSGWLVSSFNMTALIRSAINPEPGLAVSLYHVNPGAPTALVGQYSDVRGAMPLAARTPVSVDGQWVVVVRGTPIMHGLAGTAQGILVFIGGTAVSVLLFLTLWVLGRSRERALELVAEKTSLLQHQAVHDPLTGLANRVLVVETAEKMLARARRSSVPVAALYVDLDGFKQINDTFGHAAGDGILQTCAQRLRSTVRAGDTAARLSGDEFLVLVEGGTLDGGPDVVAERLLEALNQPYNLTTEAGRRVAVTASIGVAHGQRATAEELIADADVALYAAKEGGRSQYVVFSEGMRNPGEQRVSLQTDLAGALEADELMLVYQPIFDLRAERTVGVEALLRWRHPVRGMIAPDVFIPIAEESGLIIPIGRWVLETACRQTAGWRAHGHQLGVAVNVSTRQLESPHLIADVRHALTASGLEPAALTVEITETRLMRDARASAQRLAGIKELGIRVAIDDFGTGYSSLAYLRQLPVDTLKIDRSFVQGAAASRQSAALLCMLIRLGKSLGLETLGEGIETPEQLAHLQAEDCDTGQGYMFGRPVDAEAVTEFLSGQRTPVTSAV